MLTNFKFIYNNKKQNSNMMNVNLINTNYVYNNYIDIIPYNVNDVKIRGIHVIHNVYQSKYKYGIASTGLGDFIRGSYFILDFCFKYKFKPKIIFNNCISKFLKIKTNGLDKINHVLNQILSFPNANFKQFLITNEGNILEPTKDTKRIMADFVEYLRIVPVYNHNVVAYCISYPNGSVSETAKMYMQRILEPNDEMKLFVNSILTDLILVPKEYSVIHVRSGDIYLNQSSSVFKKEYIKNLLENIRLNIGCGVVDNKNYLLISDNNEIKKFILEKFPSVKTLFTEITHFGEGVVLEEQKVKNTMTDFYLLSFAEKIYAYSSYKHGSGFSYWCAQTYNIPYICKYVA